jgi:hypothetical protein
LQEQQPTAGRQRRAGLLRGRLTAHHGCSGRANALKAAVP